MAHVNTVYSILQPLLTHAEKPVPVAYSYSYQCERGLMDVAYFGPVDGVYVRTLHETLSHPGVVIIEHITDMIHPGCQTSPGGR